jgi:hypothetical protein
MEKIELGHGRKSTESFKRKLTVILSADVKGYSRLMGENEAETVKTLTSYRKIMGELILSLLAQGETPERLLEDYPELEPQDIRACLAYAHAVIADDSLDSVQVLATQETEIR